MVYRQTKYVQCAFAFLLFVLVTNVLLYQPPVQHMLSIEIKSEVAVGSLILLILNIYSILFFLAEIQVIRLHPMEIKEDKLYAAQGSTKRIIVPLPMIKKMKWGAKPDKKALEFMLRDFEPVEAQVVIVLHEPVEATMFMGRKKYVSELAFRVDEPEKLKDLLDVE